MEEIRLGLIAPEGAARSERAEAIERAATIACAELNAAGGVLGRRLALRVDARGGDPEGAVAAAAALVDVGCVALLGDLAEDAEVAALSRVARPRGIPLLRVAPCDGCPSLGEAAHVCVKAFAAAAEAAGCVVGAALGEALACVSVDECGAHLVRARGDGSFEVLASLGPPSPMESTPLADELRLQAQILAQLSEAVVLLRASDGVVVYANVAAARLFACEEVALLGRPLLAGPEDAERGPRLRSLDMPAALRRRGRWRGDVEATTCEGAPLWCAVTASASTHPLHGEVWIAALSDVSERRRLAEELARQRDFASTLLEIAPAIVLLLDPEGRIVHANSQFEEISGCLSAASVGADWFADHVPARERPAIRALFARALGGETSRGRVYPLITCRGDELAVEWHTRPIRGPDGEVSAVILVGIDVSERVRAEAALRESEARHRRLFEEAPIGICVVDAQGRFLSLNPAALRIAGAADEGALVGASILESVTEHERPRIAALLATAAAGEPARFEFVSARGPSFLATFTPHRDGEVLAMATDMTEQRQAAEALRIKDAALAGALDGVAIADRGGTITYVNDAFLGLWGHRDVAEVLGRPVLDFWEEPAAAAAVVVELMRDGTWSGELNARRVDGSIRVFRVSANAVRDGDGAVVAIMASFSDETERIEAERRRQLAEARTRESEARYQRAERGTNDGLWESNLTTGASYRAPNVAAILGFAPGELAPGFATFIDLVHPDDRGSILTSMERLRVGGEAIDVEVRMRRRSGEYLWVRSRGQITLVEGPGGVIEEVITGSISDVSRLKAAEARLQEASRIAGLGAWELDLISGRTWWSPQQYALNGVEPSAPVDQERFLEIVHPDDRAGIKAALDRVFVEDVIEQDYRIVRLDGEVRHFHGVATLTRGADGVPLKIAGTNLDVTARVVADEAIRRSLAEKEILLREIHHRVKNNLQVVGGYLHFHSKRLTVPADAAVLAELRQRIDAMSLIHQRLYLASDVACVDFGDHVRALVAEMRRSSARPTAIAIAVEAEPIALPIEVAMPASMIVCELISNIHKYAFPEGQEGRASVAVRRRGGEVELAVDDEGVGLPAGFEPGADGSFGWTLVRSLVDQLDGSLAIDAAARPGVHVRISFADPAFVS
ncbi:MAG: PAS domain S-box protein [Myxococcales bacterium]|nr:PAS domain S-box protein [Myxococcales bacterium]